MPSLWTESIFDIDWHVDGRASTMEERMASPSHAISCSYFVNCFFFENLRFTCSEHTRESLRWRRQMASTHRVCVCVCCAIHRSVAMLNHGGNTVFMVKTSAWRRMGLGISYFIIVFLLWCQFVLCAGAPVYFYCLKPHGGDRRGHCLCWRCHCGARVSWAWKINRKLKTLRFVSMKNRQIVVGADKPWKNHSFISSSRFCS